MPPPDSNLVKTFDDFYCATCYRFSKEELQAATDAMGNMIMLCPSCMTELIERLWRMGGPDNSGVL